MSWAVLTRCPARTAFVRGQGRWSQQRSSGRQLAEPVAKPR